MNWTMVKKGHYKCDVEGLEIRYVAFQVDKLGWQLFLPGESRPIKAYRSKDEAIAAAAVWAEENACV